MLRACGRPPSLGAWRRRRSGRGRTPRAGVGGGGRGAGAELREDPVDHRRLRDAGDDPHRAVAGRARERVDLWESEGIIHRGSDDDWASLSSRWPEGDQIQILYLSDKDFESLVISTG